MSKTTLHTVEKVTRRAHDKELALSDSQRLLRVPLSACVTKGDRVKLNCASAAVVCRNGDAQISLPYVAREELPIGRLHFELLIKEITEAEEWRGYQALTQLHYRSQEICGRTARLIVRNFHP